MRPLACHALGLVLCIGFASHASGQSLAQPDANAKQPFEIIRSIQAIQDQVALGNAGAKSRLPNVITQLSERLLAAKPEVWREAKNARAAVLYALSGGPAKVVRKAVELGLSPEQDLELMRGTLAYLEGHYEEAKNSLLHINASALPQPLGSRISMIQSALIAQDDPREALRFLDKARVMLPGTLVEEAALRRALLLASQISDIEKFAYLAGEYIWRFPKSEYFESFRQQFASAVIHFCLETNASGSGQIDKLVAMLEPSSQLPLYLQVGYRGIVMGKAGAALIAAAKAKQLSEAGSIGRAQAGLYEAAALLLTGRFEAAIEELNAVDVRLLPRQDRELKEATAALARMIGDAGANASASFVPEAAQATKASANAATATTSVSALIDLARLKLAETNGILHGKSP
jgi:chemotaxis protein MotC